MPGASAMAEATCLWCEKPFPPRRGGSPQRFCSAKHRSLFWSALRRWGERTVAAGILTIADIRNSDPTACTLPGAAISPPPLSQGGVQPGEVLDAGEIVEDKPSGAQPGPEPTQPFEVDPVHFWGPRLSLWLSRRIWAPGWGAAAGPRWLPGAGLPAVTRTCQSGRTCGSVPDRLPTNHCLLRVLARRQILPHRFEQLLQERQPLFARHRL